MHSISQIILVFFALFFALTVPPSQRAADAGDRMGGVPHHRTKLEGVLEYRLVTPEDEYKVGEQIIVHQFIVNLSEAPYNICETCLVEGLRIKPLREDPDVLCGWFADHLPGFMPIRRILAPGETHEEQSDVTGQPCAISRFGPGEYVIRGRYCHEKPNTKHGIDSPEYCVEAEQVVIRVMGKKSTE